MTTEDTLERLRRLTLLWKGDRRGLRVYPKHPSVPRSDEHSLYVGEDGLLYLYGVDVSSHNGDLSDNVDTPVTTEIAKELIKYVEDAVFHEQLAEVQEAFLQAQRDQARVLLERKLKESP